MGRLEVIKQPLLMVVFTFLAMMSVILWRVAVAPYLFETDVAADMPLGKLIDGLASGSVTLTFIIGIIVSFLSASLLAGIIVKYSVSLVRTYLPMIIYAITAFGICVSVGSLSAFFASLLLILSSAAMIAAFRRSYQFGNVFRSAFFLGILPMLYAQSVVLCLILPITLALYQRTPREWVAAFVGLFLPLVLCSVGWWAAGESLGFVFESLISSISGVSSSINVIEVFIASSISVKIFIGIYILLSFYSIFVILIKITGMRTRARKIYLHFIWLLILCLAMIFIPSGNIISLGLLAVPGSVVISAFFIKHSGWVTIIIYIVLLALVFLINIFPMF